MDVREAPIERITPTGVKTRDAEYALDALLFATGYDAVTGPLNRIAIHGAGGQTLQDKFAEGRAPSEHGIGEGELLYVSRPEVSRFEPCRAVAVPEDIKR